MSNLAKIQQIRRLTKEIESDHVYLYGRNGGVAAFFQDPDQDFNRTDRDASFRRYVRRLEQKIERRNRLRDELRVEKSSRRNVTLLNRRVPESVLRHIGSFITGPQHSYKSTAAVLRSTRSAARGRKRQKRHTRRRQSHKKRHL
jgi:hypothetical protein